MMTKPIKYSFAAAFMLLVAVSVIIGPAARQAHATHFDQIAACTGCSCTNDQHSQTQQHIEDEHDQTRDFITDEFQYHQSWVMNDFFLEAILPAMMMMTEQLVSTGMNQTLVIGSFFDAKHQLETQRIFQRKLAEAHKNYHPTTEMCTIGTAADSLAAAEQNGRTTAHILSQRSLERQLLSMDSNASDGPKEDREGRLALFINRYCDVNDNNQTLDIVCTSGSAPNATVNKDVNYPSLVATPMTIDADFTDGTTDPNTDEIDILSLSSYLTAHRVAPQIPSAITVSEAAQTAYMDLRSVIAKRSVAENSLYSVIGMKTSGTEESGTSLQTREYGQIILEQLGIPASEAEAMLGERPSYYALIQLIGKKIYQQPEFFTNLYDKPANVLRKDAAMRAIDLMIDRNIYKSDLRQEAVLSVLLELEIMKHHRDVQNQINKLNDMASKEN